MNKAKSKQTKDVSSTPSNKVSKANSSNQFVFLPLGGVGEIGMNSALYGRISEDDTSWIMVDLGMSFAGEEAPGVDLIYPDLNFAEKEKANIAALFITHGHEDHIGAILAMWPRIKCPIYCPQFVANLLEAKIASERSSLKLNLKVFNEGEKIKVGKFEVEPIKMAHSMPDCYAFYIKTDLGKVLHTGDWKIDQHPVIGNVTNLTRLKELGEEGVDVLVCDSTNAGREGISPSESEVAQGLNDAMQGAEGQIAVTLFSSNVARLKSIAEAARANDRHVVVVGRAIDRMLQIADEEGLLEGLPPFLGADALKTLDKNKIVALLTGSQGEHRAALARVAYQTHPFFKMNKGDRVIFSSRTIPGNEVEVNGIINALIARDIEVITDKNLLVHVSGHPRQEELKELYSITKPKKLIPVHGEMFHLNEQKKLALSNGIADVLVIKNGDMASLSSDKLEIIDNIQTGRLYLDGKIIVNTAEDDCIKTRRKLGNAGIVVVNLQLNKKFKVDDLVIELIGIPEKNREGVLFSELVEQAVFDVIAGLRTSKGGLNIENIEEKIRQVARKAIYNDWNKKPKVVATVFEV